MSAPGVLLLSGVAGSILYTLVIDGNRSELVPLEAVIDSVLIGCRTPQLRYCVEPLRDEPSDDRPRQLKARSVVAVV
ncbi:hypothetical protein C496_22084 [Natronorubrum tibetense GA33]|uniref:Uncharacterized protein n=1 Tax=Natronorubrum tibetense GA33 TaxID=1114856 RepID=L9VGS4_9EURY|nr:hypothetical protein C496_22084 [Natronorubrum tibetense GA33]